MNVHTHNHFYFTTKSISFSQKKTNKLLSATISSLRPVAVNRSDLGVEEQLSNDLFFWFIHLQL